MLVPLERFADRLDDGGSVMNDERQAARLGLYAPRELEEGQGQVDQLTSLQRMGEKRVGLVVLGCLVLAFEHVPTIPHARHVDLHLVDALRWRNPFELATLDQRLGCSSSDLLFDAEGCCSSLGFGRFRGGAMLGSSSMAERAKGRLPLLGRRVGHAELLGRESAKGVSTFCGWGGSCLQDGRVSVRAA